MPIRVQRSPGRADAPTSDRGRGLPAATLPPLPPAATPGRRWRFRRNLVIYVAHCQGLSQRLLAEAFDLPRSRIGEIVAEFRRHDADEGGPRTVAEDREPPPPPPPPPPA